MRRTWLCVIGALVVLLVLTGPDATGQPAPTFTLTPNHGVPGTQITAEGDGFGNFGEVTLYLDSIAAANQLAEGAAPGGSFTLRFNVPATSPGAHSVIACLHAPSASACRQQASAQLTVDPPPTTTTRRTTTTGAGATTTSSRGLTGPSTTLGGDPPAPSSTFPLGAASTTTLPNLAAPGAELPDLSVRYMELTQGIQNFDNKMPLVAGRRTWLRVYPVTDNGPLFEWPDIDGAVQLVRGNKTKIIYPENGPIATHSSLDRTNLDHSLNFVIPSDWTEAGQTKFRALLWTPTPAGIDNEPNPNNNLRELTKTFHDGEDPLLYVIPMDPSANPGDEPLSSTMTDVPEWMGNSLLDFHPVANPSFLVFQQSLTPGPEAAEPGIWDLTADRDEPLIRLAWIHGLWDLPDTQRLSGVFNNSLPADGYTGWSKSSYFSFWTKMDTGTAAHEVGHQRGLKHVACKDDDNDGVGDELAGGALDPTHPNSLPKCSLAPTDPKGYYGFTTYRSPLVVYSNDPTSPAAGWPMMSYQGPGWSDPYHYCRLLTAYGIACSPASIGVPGKNVGGPAADCTPKQDGPFMLQLCLGTDQPGSGNTAADPFAQFAEEGDRVLLVSGKLNLVAQTGSIGRVATVARRNGKVDHELPDVAPFRISTYDAAGKLLTRVPLDLDGGGHGNQQASDPQSVGFFQMLVSVGDVAKLQLEGAGGNVLATRNASASAPTVQVRVPRAADVADRDFDLEWTMADADGDPLTATVLWSVDDGQTWRPVADGLTAARTHVNANAAALPGGRVRVRVVVSDGLRSATATSRAFRVPEASPQLALSGPTAPVPRYSLVRLAASAVDPEDGVLSKVTWTSSVDGRLGTGASIETRDLSVGDHVVTATATDGDGNKVTGQLTFTVVDDGRPKPRSQGDVPDAERRFTLASSTDGDDEGAPAALIVGAVVAVLALGVAGAVATRRRRSRVA